MSVNDSRRIENIKVMMVGGGSGGLPENPLAPAHGGTGNTTGYVQIGKTSGSTIGTCATAEGYDTVASGNYSHAEGRQTNANGSDSHAEGLGSQAMGLQSHAENASYATGDMSHSEGDGSLAQGEASHSEGYATVAAGKYSHAEGRGKNASAAANKSYAYGEASHVEGYYTKTNSGAQAGHAEGKETLANGVAAHAEGISTQANNDGAHAEGTECVANGDSSHAEGYETVTDEYAIGAHAEGCETEANYSYAHAEGYKSVATAQGAHAEGFQTEANGDYAHSEGSLTEANGHYSHAGGYNTVAGELAQTVIGKYNKNKSDTLLEVGNGTSSARHNAFEVRSNGDIADGNGYTLSAVIDAISEEKTATGNPIVITDALPVPATSLVTTINAIQDLHGYDHPWAGGAGKNKLPMTVSAIKALNTEGTWSGNVYTNKGVTFTVLTDNDNNVIGIKTNGAPTNGNLQFNLCSNFKAVSGTTYTINGSPSGVSDSTYRIFPSSQIAFPAGNRLSDDVAANRTKTAAGNEDVTFFINIFNGVNVDDKVFYPQIEIGTQATAFAPYSNICPISGRTSVTITDVDAESQTATVTVQLGQTVYGGSLNVTTGVLTVEWISIVPTEVENVLYDSGLGLYYWIVVNNITSINGANVISDSFKSDSAAAVGNCYISGQGHHIVVIPVDQTLNTKALASAWVAANTPQFVYELATPTTIQLTPTQLQMLKGYNRLSSDGGGDITLTYLANRLDALLAALQSNS